MSAFRSDRPKSATNETSVIPIISAAAVDAVRPGLRCTLSQASLPDVRPARANGQPITLTSGRTSREKIAASAMNRVANPPPSASSRRGTGMPCVKNPYASSTIAREPSTAATTGPVLPPRACDASEPSRTAAIGATWVARSAGTSPATTVSPVPATSGTRIVRGSIGRPASGSAIPSALNTALRPTARPIPAAIPTIEANRPVTSASSTTERSTCRRDAPRVRSVASSRVRCETVIASVLKITKPPTKRATRPKPTSP